jgi:hypothetical protein
MEWAEASLKTVKGVVSSSWHRTSNGRIVLEVTIPVNASATIYADAVYKLKGTGLPRRFVIKQ